MNATQARAKTVIALTRIEGNLASKINALYDTIGFAADEGKSSFRFNIMNNQAALDNLALLISRLEGDGFVVVHSVDTSPNPNFNYLTISWE